MIPFTLLKQVHFFLSFLSYSLSPFYTGAKLYAGITFPDLGVFTFSSFQMTKLEGPVFCSPNRGRPKKMAPITAHVKEQFCSKCGKAGHNKRSCVVPDGMVMSSSSTASSSSSPSSRKQVVYPKCYILAKMGAHYFQEIASSLGKKCLNTSVPMSSEDLGEILSLVEHLQDVEESQKVTALYFLLKVRNLFFL